MHQEIKRFYLFKRRLTLAVCAIKVDLLMMVMVRRMAWASMRAAFLAGFVLSLCLAIKGVDISDDYPTIFSENEVSECGDIRIPQMTVTPSGVLLLAQCRQANASKSSSKRRRRLDDQSEAKVVKKFSADFGDSWSPMEVLTPDHAGYSHGQVVYDAVRKQVLMQYQYHPSVDPEFNSTLYQRISVDDGKTWGEAKDITPLITRCNPDGVSNMQVGTAGAKIQTQDGRIIFVGHAKGRGCRWFTDDGGKTYDATDPYKVNEASIAEYAPNKIYMNARGSSFSWRGNRTSFWSNDDGAHFSEPQAAPIREDASEGCSVGLVAEPPSLASSSVPRRLFFSEPIGPKRIGLVVRCSLDGGKTWPYSKAVTSPGAVAAYSSMRFVPSHEKKPLLIVWEDKPNMRFTRISTGWCSRNQDVPAEDPAGQQITWFYSNSLLSGANFLGEVLKLTEVKGLKQKDVCRIFRVALGQYLGVCNSRPAPSCPMGPESQNAPPVTYTIIVKERSEVDAWHQRLAAVGDNIVVTAPSNSSKFDCYAFNFYDANRQNGLGCYRFEVQFFNDPNWPQLR